MFSKTSLQSRRISPENPRAVYFGDEMYVAWTHGSSLLEISTSDPNLGAAFYTVRMTPERPVLRRENHRCLACHQLSMTEDVPGHMIRSVLTRPSGVINSLERSYVTDHTSPIAERWGGWYVTGQLGGMTHMGNAFLRDDGLVPFGKPNREHLRDDFDTSHWPTPHSDVVALMVLEHQTQTHNAFTAADFALRLARHDADSGASDLTTGGEPLENVLRRGSERIVGALLFVDEAKLHAPVSGSNSFAADFARRGPFDSQGRSLREFDLQTRLFRYPCSYLIYSSAFDSLQPRLRERVYRRLWRVLSGHDESEAYAHLDADTRLAIKEILRETKADLPDYWDQ